MATMLSDSLECARLLSSLSAIQAPMSIPKGAPFNASAQPNKASIDWFLSGSGSSAPPALPASSSLYAAHGAGLSIPPPLGLTPPSSTGHISSPLVSGALPSTSAPFPSMVSHADLGPALALLISGMVPPTTFQVPAVDAQQPSNIRDKSPPFSSAGSSNPRKREAPGSVSPLDLETVQRKRPALDDGGKPSSYTCATPDSTWSRASTADDHGCGSSSVSEADGSEGSDRSNQTIALDCATAADIYRQRPSDAGTKYGSMACASNLASLYDVSPKTIRDIWNRKSWVKATKPLWTEEEKKDHVPRSHRSREERRGKLRRVAA